MKKLFYTICSSLKKSPISGGSSEESKCVMPTRKLVATVIPTSTWLMAGFLCFALCSSNMLFAQSGAALDFDGSNDRVEIADAMWNDFGSSDFTVECWVKKQATSAGWSNVAAVGKWNTGGSPGTNEWLIGLTSNGSNQLPNFNVEVGSATYAVVGTTPMVVGTWYHIAGVRQGTTLRIYVNGILEGTTTNAGITNINNIAGREIMLGKLDGFGGHTNMEMDELRVWSAARSGADILANKDCEVPTTGTNLLVNYHFNQGVANGNNTGLTTLLDVAGNSRNGTLFNFGLTGVSVSNWTTPGGVVSGTSCGPCVLVLDTMTTNVSCFGSANGSATVSVVSGGVAPYTYLWSNGSSSQTITGLSGGVYTATVTATGGCSNTVSVTITEPAELFVNVTGYDPDCAVGNDGIIELNSIMGGSLPLTYLWSNGQTDMDIFGLTAGTYTVTITENNGCTLVKSYTLADQDTEAPKVFCKVGTGLAFDGVNEYVTVPDNAVLENMNNLTVMGWVKIGALPTQNYVPFGKENAYRLIIGSDGSYHFVVATTTNGWYSLGTVASGGTDVLPVGQWVHLAGVYNGTNVRIFVNGVLKGETSDVIGGNIVNNGNPFTIAQSTSGNIDYFNGKIDEVAVFNAELSDVEIQNYMGTSLAGAEPNLVVSYNFEDGAGSTATDNASSSLNGTLNNMEPADWMRTPFGPSDAISVYTDLGLCTAALTFDVAVLDNCGVPTLSNDFNLSNNSSGAYPKGATTVTWSATDANPTTTTCAFSVTVVDSIKPVAICQNITLPLDSTGNGTAAATAVDNLSTDNCSIMSRTLDVTAFTCANIAGPNVVTLTVTDPSNNSSTCTASVTVVDLVPPVAVCQDITVHLNASGNVSTTAAMVNNGSSDACGVQSVVLNDSTFTCVDVAVLTSITLTVTDVNSNTKTCTASVTVLDTVAPVAVCQNVTVWLNASGAGNATAAAVNNGSSDACGILSLSLNDSTFTCANIAGPNFVTLTVTDLSSNLKSCTAAVTVLDTVKPKALCQNVTVWLNASGMGSTSSSLVNNGSTDACGIQSVVLSDSTFTCASVAGPNNVTLTVTDLYSNTSSCSAMVTVLDTVKPIAICQNVTVWLNTSGMGSTSAAAVNNGSNDACGVQSLVLSDSTFTCANVSASNTITLTVTDVNSNIQTCTATVTVLDTIKPIALCQNVTVWLNAAGMGSTSSAAVNNGSTDACGIQSVVLSDSTYTCANVAGSNTVTLTVTDVNGNFSICTANITVLDTVKPNAICQNVTVWLNGAGMGATSSAAVNNGSTDACGIQSIVLSDSTYTCSNIAGPNTVTLTVTDVNMNSKTCTASVTVLDTVPPTMTCPPSLTINAAPSSCTQLQGWVVPGATDNCGILSKVVSNDNGVSIQQFGALDFGLFPTGITTVMYTATDIHANTTTCTFSITVRDLQLPVITGCPSTIVQSTAPGVCTAVVNWVAPTASDNCPGVALSANYPPGSTFAAGTTLVTYTATDASNNTKTCTFNVTINDTEKPVIAAPAGITINCGDSAPAGATNYAGYAILGGTASDNCTVSDSLSITSTDGSLNGNSCGASIVRTYTVTDQAGNSQTATQTITVSPAAVPTMTALAPITVACGSIPAPSTIAYSNGLSGGCLISGSSNPSTFSAAPGACGGTLTETWTATDVCGRTIASVSRIITVDPAALPTMVAPGSISVSCGAIPASSTISFTNGLSGGCLISGTSNPSTFSAAPGACGGTVTETWTAVDNCGRALASVSRLITVNPAALPTMTAPGPITVACGGIPAPSTISFSNALSGGCLIIGTSNASTFSATPGVCGGTVTETWTATDICGRTIASVSREITVNPAALPTMTPPNPITVACGNIPAASAIAFSNGLIGGCEISGTSNLSTFSSSPGACGGTVTETWTAPNDACGRPVASVSRIITVSPASLPTMTALQDITITCSALLPIASTLPFTNNEMGNCLISGTSNLSTFTTVQAGNCNGAVTETWTATDACGRTLSSVSRTISIIDNVAPIITLVGDATVHTCLNEVYNDAGATATDSCAGNLTNSINVFNPVNTGIAGTYTITYSVTDNCGNSAAQVTRTVIVDPKPSFSFTATVTGRTPQSGNSNGGPQTVTLDFCAGESFTFSNYTTSPSSQVRFLEALVSGTGNVTYNNNPISVPRAPQDIDGSLFSGTYGPYGLSSGVSGSLTQTFLPYYDTNNNGVYNPGVDCLGDVITLVYNVYANPDVTATPAADTICDEGTTDIVLSSNVSGTTFSWVVQATTGSVTGQSAGSGTSISQVLDNTGSGVATVTYRVTPTGPAPNNCVGAYADVTITVFPRPILRTTVNGVQLTNNYDNTSETASFTVCNTNTNNVFFTQFIDLLGATPAANVKVIQQFTKTNVTFAPTYGVYPISGYAGAFDRQVSLINPTMNGTLVMTFRTFFDIDNDDQLDPDECANDLVVYTITVDGQAPVLNNVPTDVTVDCGNIPSAPTVTATDNYGTPTVVLSETTTQGTAGTCAYYDYAITRTWTATDSCGITSTASQVITVNPPAVPTMTALAPITVSCGTALTPSTIPFSNALSGGCLISGTSNASTFSTVPGACGGTVTETWTANDLCGRTISTVSRMITISPATLPTMTALPDITVACGGLPTASIISYTNGLSGGCLISGSSNVSTFSTTPTACGGTVVETWTATDECGRALTTVTRQITVLPAALPTMSALADITVACGSIPASSTINYSNGLSGGCLISGTSNSSTFSATPGACGGTFTETWTATDNCGRTIGSVSRTITVSPATLPTMTAPTAITVACGSIPAPSTISYSNGLSGGCLISGTSNLSTFSATPSACGGTVTETWTATDNCGRTISSVSRLITVSPAALPTMTPPAAITVTCGSVPAASTLNFSNGLSGDCLISGTSNPSTFSAIPGACGGTVTETWTANDLCGRTISSVSRIITVNPADLPTMSAPVDITVACGALPAASMIAYSNGLSGGCLLSGSSNASTFSSIPSACGGTVTETWTATDACGRALSSTSRLITVLPAALPTMTALTDITVSCGSIPAPTTINYSNGLSGGCQISGTSNLSTFSATPGACGGTVTETWTATDNCGRTISAVSRTITVNPAALPTMTAPGAITVACGSIPAPSTISFSNGLSGGCLISGTSNLSTLSALPSACGGTVTETWTATDNCGRTITSVSRVITVSPAALPTIAAPANITVTCGTLLPTPSTLAYSNGLTGGCLISGTSNPSTIVVNNSNNCNGSAVETWTATDACGRTLASVSRTISIIDNVAPTALCKNVTLFLNNNGTASTSGTAINNNSTDNCSGVQSLSLSKTNFNCSNFGQNIVILSVTDNCQNVGTCSAVVTVGYNQAPVAKCRNATVVLNPSGNGSVTTNGINNGSTDLCNTAGLTFSLSKTTFNCSNLGPNTVVLTVTSPGGSSSTCSATVTVRDLTKPVARCKNLNVPLVNGNSITIQPSQINNGSTDACTSPPNLVGLTPNTFTCANSGPNIVTLTVSDGAGNSGTCSSIVTINCNNSNIKIDEVQAEANLVELLDVFPNPASEKVEVRLNDGAIADRTVSIVDYSGKVLFSKVVPASDKQLTIDLLERKLPSGIYTLSVKFQNQVLSKQLVIFRD